MMKYIFVALVCMFAIAQAQETEVIVIDPFEVDTPSVVIILPSNPTFPNCEEAHTQDASIIGGERGIQFCATEGAANAVLTAGTSSGAFACASPSNAGGFATLQYDGVDGTITVDPSGLFGAPDNDWTVASAFGLRTIVEADFATTAEVRVYSGNVNDYCTATINIPGGTVFANVLVEYVEFSDVGNGCDFSNVGAFEYIVQVGSNVDVVIEQFAVVGPIIYNECTCVCPEFTCIIAVDHDDDGFIYYATSDFDDDGNNNPTTDLSTAYSTNDDGQDDNDGGFTSLFSSDFTYSKSSDFSTITTFGSFFSSDDGGDDDDNSGSGSSSSSSNNDDDDDSSSSSSASAVAPALALVAITMALVL